ncbi:liver carboxylesterase 1-like isoform X1 [Alexandromys fortis]|uniref:liver carboxylesterase 1-like isoform X1 n=1 Tax=Alexandromys fortis TaxID=100897 RepID=UPI002152086F|nr:liver carboxylesterase 1-like isoform X1 [Microtus fortis]
MMSFHVLVLILLPVCMTYAGHSSSPPVVDTVHGKVLGKYASLEGFEQPVAVFLGVPFAKPPLGSLRFAPPQPAEPWSFVKDATSYPPMCSQDATVGKMLSDLFTNRKENIPLQFSEDCLYLNIYTPANLTKSMRLPVMVWIHGGSLVVGGASTYDGLALSAHENVVVVTIQYRLGIWGFFSTGDEHSRGNWGHLDQLAALRWVQDNIVNFGGDPDSVTIFGESAGGESVSVLVLSPLAKNLFHRAISESGVALTPGMVRKDVKPVAEQVAIAAGCKTTTSAAMVNCLRQKTEDELMEINLKLKPFKVNLLGDLRESCPFLPTAVDGVFLPKTPEEILAEKNFSTVPYMVGINKQEFGWLLPLIMGYPLSSGKLDQKTATSLLRKSSPFLNVPEDVIPAAIKEYLGGAEDLVQNRDRFVDLIGDVLFAVPSVIVARHHRDAGAPVYMYEFQYHPSFSSDLKPEMVTGDHGDELFSVFGAPFTKGGASSEEINVSKMVMKFWGNFAWNGNPNEKTLSAWPEYDQNEGYLKIGATTQAAQGLKDKEVAFWTKVWTKEAVEKLLQEKN